MTHVSDQLTRLNKIDNFRTAFEAVAVVGACMTGFLSLKAFNTTAASLADQKGATVTAINIPHEAPVETGTIALFAAATVVGLAGWGVNTARMKL